MSVDVAEVVVRASSDIDDAEEGLEDVEEGVEDAKEEMDDAADSMADLSKRFRGAMTTIVSGIAVSTGFLLSTVPVLQETMQALGSVFEAVGLRLDTMLRPAFGRLNDLIFSFTDWMHDADGATGVLADTIAVLTPIVLGLGAAISVWAVKTFGVIGAVVKLGSVLKAAAIAIGGLIAAVGLIPIAIGAAVIALGGLIYIFRDEIRAAIGTAVESLFNMADTLRTLVDVAAIVGRGLLSRFIGGVRDFAGSAVNAVADVVGQITDTFRSLIERARAWGVQLIRRIIDGIRSVAGGLRNAVEGINLTAGVEIGDIAGSVGSVGQSTSSDGSGFIGSVGGGASKVFLGGREVSEETGRFAKDRLNRRGA